MKIKLPDNISSSQDLVNLIIEIKEYARWFSQHAIMKRVNNNKTTNPPMISSATSELIRNLGSKGQISRQDLDDLISNLEKFKNNNPHINITLAAPPSNDTKKSR